MVQWTWAESLEVIIKIPRRDPGPRSQLINDPMVIKLRLLQRMISSSFSSRPFIFRFLFPEGEEGEAFLLLSNSPPSCSSLRCAAES